MIKIRCRSRQLLLTWKSSTRSLSSLNCWSTSFLTKIKRTPARHTNESMKQMSNLHPKSCLSNRALWSLVTRSSRFTRNSLLFSKKKTWVTSITPPGTVKANTMKCSTSQSQRWPKLRTTNLKTTHQCFHKCGRRHRKGRRIRTSWQKCRLLGPRRNWRSRWTPLNAIKAHISCLIRQCHSFSTASGRSPRIRAFLIPDWALIRETKQRRSWCTQSRWRQFRTFQRTTKARSVSTSTKSSRGSARAATHPSSFALTSIPKPNTPWKSWIRPRSWTSWFRTLRQPTARYSKRWQ